MGQLIVNNPYNQEKIEELEFLSETTISQYILDAENIANHRKKWLPKLRRIEILEKFKELILENKVYLVEQAIKEGGKPYKDSVVEIDRGIEGVGVAIEALKQLSGHEIPMNISKASEGRMAYTFHRPRGLVVAISAFNHPFNLIIHQVIPAIAAGCPILVKPSSLTPLSCRSIVQFLYQAGLEKEYCRMVLCSNELAQKLVTNSSTSFLSFIGSGKVGWYLRSQLAPGAQCVLEHGGVAPVIIDETADLRTCIPLIVKGGFYHAGQVCVSVQRVFVHSSRKKEFLKEFTKQVSELKTGDPLKAQTDVGPLISFKEVERVSSWVQEAIDQGASCNIGGDKVSETIYSPTVLSDVSFDSTISQKEIFGPVVIVQHYDDFSEAISKANNVDFAFQASVFTQNLENALLATQELEGRAVMVNDHTAFRVDWMPFGGYKHSGLGVGGIGHAIKDLSIEKMIVIKSTNLS